MKIHSLELTNFRSFYGNSEIIFAIDEERNTTLIWGDNASGKTNLLNAITWCLYEEFTPNFKRRNDLLNHQAELEGIKSFSVSVVIEENSSIFRVTRTGGEKKDFRVYKVNQFGDHEQLHNPVSVVNSILPRDMMKYFFIDGEGTPIAVSNSGEIDAKNSIKDILGFKIAEKAQQDLSYIKREQTRDLKKLQISDELNLISNKLESAYASNDRYIEQLESLENALNIIQNDLNDVDYFLNSYNIENVSRLNSERERVEYDINSIENDLRQIQREKRTIVKNYAWSAFANNLSLDAINFIDESQYRGTIPSPYNESLIKDILESAKCICGAEVTAGSTALDNIKGLLQKAANPAIYNRIQQARSHLQVVLENSKKAPEEIKQIFQRESAKEHDREIKLKQLEELSTKISEINIDEIKQKETDRRRLVRDKDTTNRQIGALKSNLENLAKKIQSYENQISSLSKNEPLIEEIRERIDFIDKVSDTIQRSFDKALDDVRKLLASVMSDFISASFIRNINVRITEDFRVGLYQNVDGEYRLMAPSGGLTSILTLIYTSTLVQIAKLRAGAEGNILSAGVIAPLVLDAPFSHVSETYTAGLTEALADKSDQLIIFLFDKSAKGGEKIIREKNKCGKEYYLMTETTIKQNDRKMKTINILDNEYPLIKYGSERNNVQIVEVY